MGITNLGSVTWTKVSLKLAKIRATPKTSSPVRSCQFFARRNRGQASLPSRTLGPREMFSAAGRAAFFGGILIDLLVLSEWVERRLEKVRINVKWLKIENV